LITAFVINRATTDRPDFRQLIPLLILAAVIPIFAELLWRLIIYLMNRTDALGREKITNEMLEHLIERSYGFHVNNFAGSMVAKVGRFSGAFEGLYDLFVFEIMGVMISLAFAIAIIFNTFPPVGFIVVGFLIAFIAVIAPLTRKRFVINKIRAEAESTLTGQLADSLTNAITIKTFAHEEYEYKLFRKVTKDATQKRIRSWDFQNIPVDLVSTSTISIMNGIAIIGAIFAYYYYGLEAGSVFLVINYIAQITARFWNISKVMRSFENNLSDATEMAQILAQHNEIIDEKNAKKLRVKNPTIRFNNVSFAYEDGKKLFDGLNLYIKAGARVGLIGPSGGGKTSVTKLLLRFMDIQSGSIEIDGQNIASCTQKSLRENIAYVPQEPLLFHRSLMENIRYGKPGASDAEVIEAARKAHADEFIQNLQHGYDTLVGERGIKLSGGQRQRVAIARAILKDAPIIILDEATSALDSESEKLIQDALEKLMKNRTTLVIAHRLSTIRHLDRILVLDKGLVVEDGTHTDLMDMSGLYASLWNHQSGGFIPD